MNQTTTRPLLLLDKNTFENRRFYRVEIKKTARKGSLPQNPGIENAPFKLRS